MTVIPDLEKQLVRAAARASATPERPRRRWRLTLASTTAVGLVVLAIAAIDLGGGSGDANAAAKVLEQTARSAASGLAAPRLHPGQAWFTREMDMIASPWQPVTPGQLPPTFVVPSSRAVVESESRSESWTFVDGDGRGRSRQVGRPRFFGSAAERALWLAKGSHSTVVQANGSSVTMSNGFTVGTKTLSYQQVLHFPTDPSAVLRFLAAAEPAGSDALDSITSLLVQVPLLPAARAAVFRALEKIPGVRYLGSTRDPLGRPGVAIAIDRSATERVFTLNGPKNTAVLHIRSELIFNPQTAGLLAQETLLLNPPHIAGVRSPFPTSWTAYLASRVVPQSSAPTLKQLGYRPPPRLPLPPPSVSSPPVGFPGATTATAAPSATTTTTVATPAG
jgi:hypothetical protein